MYCESLWGREKNIRVMYVTKGLPIQWYILTNKDTFLVKVKILQMGLQRKVKRTVEAAHIPSSEETNQRKGCYRLSQGAARTILTTTKNGTDQSAGSNAKCNVR